MELNNLDFILVGLAFIFILIMVIITSVIAMKERRSWNRGRCRRCGDYYEITASYSSGCEYTCPSCGDTHSTLGYYP